MRTIELCEEDLELLFDALERYRKYCKGIANRPIQGYGSATEKENKQKWREKEEELWALQERISNEFI